MPLKGRNRAPQGLKKGEKTLDVVSLTWDLNIFISYKETGHVSDCMISVSLTAAFER